MTRFPLGATLWCLAVGAYAAGLPTLAIYAPGWVVVAVGAAVASVLVLWLAARVGTWFRFPNTK